MALIDDRTGRVGTRPGLPGRIAEYKVARESAQSAVGAGTARPDAS